MAARSRECGLQMSCRSLRHGGSGRWTVQEESNRGVFFSNRCMTTRAERAAEEGRIVRGSTAARMWVRWAGGRRPASGSDHAAGHWPSGDVVVTSAVTPDRRADYTSRRLQRAFLRKNDALLSMFISLQANPVSNLISKNIITNISTILKLPEFRIFC